MIFERIPIRRIAKWGLISIVLMIILMTILMTILSIIREKNRLARDSISFQVGEMVMPTTALESMPYIARGTVGQMLREMNNRTSRMTMIDTFMLLLCFVQLCFLAFFAAIFVQSRSIKKSLGSMGYSPLPFWVLMDVSLYAGEGAKRLPPAEQFQVIPGCSTDVEGIVTLSNLLAQHRRSVRGKGNSGK